LPKAAAAALLLAGLAGCGAPFSPARFALTNQIDGDYQGDVRLVRGRPPVCERSQYGVALVGDRTLWLAYNPTTIFTVPVQDDGSVHAEMLPYVLDGRVAHERLRFTVTSPECQTAYDMDFIWNHS